MQHLAGLEHSKQIESSRLKFQETNDLNQELNKIFYDRTNNAREKEKQHIRYLRYLIESNLYLDRKNSKKIKLDELNYLIAFTNWLVVLQDNADLAHWKIYNSIIEGLEDYLVNTERITESFNEDDIIHRSYNINDYISQSEHHFYNFKIAFQKDIGFDILDFAGVLAFFCGAFDKDKICKRILFDVYSITFDNAVKYIENDKLGKVKLPSETIKLIITLQLLIQIN